MRKQRASDREGKNAVVESEKARVEVKEVEEVETEEVEEVEEEEVEEEEEEVEEEEVEVEEEEVEEEEVEEEEVEEEEEEEVEEEEEEEEVVEEEVEEEEEEVEVEEEEETKAEKSAEVEANEDEHFKEVPNEKEEPCEEDPNQEEEEEEEEEEVVEEEQEEEAEEEEEFDGETQAERSAEEKEEVVEEEEEEEGETKAEKFAEVEPNEEDQCEEEPDEKEELCKEDPNEEDPCEEYYDEEEPCEGEEDTDDETNEGGDEEVCEDLSEADSDGSDEHQSVAALFNADKKGDTNRSDDSMPKRQKRELTPKLESQAGSSSIDMQDILKNLVRNEEQEKSIGNKRRSRWDIAPGADGQAVDGGAAATKKRKSRWANADGQLELQGPFELPDFVKGLVTEIDLDPEILKLNAQLHEITQKLLSREICNVQPENERSPSPPPIYNELGIRINTWEARIRAKLIEQRKNIISDLIKRNPTFKPPSDYKPPRLSKKRKPKFYKKLYVPVRENPGYNFFGLIIGPNGLTQKRMQKETGARIFLRGKDVVMKKRTRDSLAMSDELHVSIEADTQNSLDAAVAMVEKLLVPMEERENKLKRSQLRELAELKLTSKTTVPCAVCGDSSHLTAACVPSTASAAPGTCTACHQVGSLTQLGIGLFSPLRGPPVSSSTVTLTVDPAVDCLSSHNFKTEKEIDEATIYVSYLPQSMDDNKLINLFLPFGQICGATIIREKSTGLSKGYGFIKYADATFAAEAVARMHGYRIEGKILAVRVAGRPQSTADNNTGLGVPQSFAHLPTYSAPATIVQGNTGPAAIANNNTGLGFPQSFAHLPTYPARAATAQGNTGPAAIANNNHGLRVPQSFAHMPTYPAPTAIAPGNSSIRATANNNTGLGLPQSFAHMPIYPAPAAIAQGNTGLATIANNNTSLGLPQNLSHLPTYPGAAAIAQVTPSPAAMANNTTGLGLPQNFAHLPTYPGPSAIAQGKPSPAAIANNNTGFGVPQNFAHLPTYPGPAANSQGKPGPVDWPGPLGSMVPDSLASFPKSLGLLLRTDPISRQPPASFGSSSQTRASHSSISRTITPSRELAQFPGYLNSLDS